VIVHVGCHVKIPSERLRVPRLANLFLQNMKLEVLDMVDKEGRLLKEIRRRQRRRLDHVIWARGC
jgi:hypothetical protein